MAELWWARLLSTGPNYKGWIKVFPDGRVPLLKPISVNAQLGETEAEVYLIDLQQLSSAQLDTLSIEVASRFPGSTPAEVRYDLVRPLLIDGLYTHDSTFPIRAVDVYVAFSMKCFI